MLTLVLERRPSGPTSTIGLLARKDGDHYERLAWTCEDVVREVPGEPVRTWKVRGQTAIPSGVYPVIVTPSARFGRPLPLLLHVEGFEGIRIHPGNGSGDTEGCILLGEATDGVHVYSSRRACETVQGLIQAELDAGGSVQLEVRNAQEERVAA